MSLASAGLNLTGISCGLTIGNSCTLDQSALFDTCSNFVETETAEQFTEYRKNLPIFSFRDEIIKSVREHTGKIF